MAPDSSLVPFPTSETIAEPAGVVVDPLSGDLLVYDQGAGARVVRVERGTGAVREVLTGLGSGIGWAGIDMSPDGRLLIVTDFAGDAVHVLGRCDAGGDPALDCDGDGVYDYCEIALGQELDCNGNGRPDHCDLTDLVSADCNGDGIPDECPVCPPVEVVFIMDTSTSMDDEASALCGDLVTVIARLESAGLEVSPSLLSICNLPGGAYGCLTDRIDLLLGTTVPGAPPAGVETLGACPGGLEVCLEDWGRATAVVAGLYPWRPAGESVRLIVPLSDEGPWCGDPVTTLDTASIDHAVAVARWASVVVSPITGTGSSTAVINLAQTLADSTGGRRFSSSAPTTDIAEGIVEIVLDACRGFSDCNGNGTLDACDIADGTSQDLDGDGIPDECATATTVPVRPELGFGLRGYPNPFNPVTVLRFELPQALPVRLDILGVDGRRITTLTTGELGAGIHEVAWDGEDGRGRRVASGSYLAVLRAGGREETVRVVLLK
jgi:hypothetical protein